MNEILRKTLYLTFSSTRPMPARFTQNGDRNQSFCIDYEPLTKEHDEAMASEAWGVTSDFLSDDKCKNEILSKEQFNMVTRCGEDMMVGAFILTKLEGASLLEEMKRTIIEDSIEAFADEKFDSGKVLKGEQVNKYFDYCLKYGHERAKQ